MNATVRRIANNPVHTKIYNLVFRNSSTLVAASLVGAFVFEAVVDSGVNQAWNIANRGVRRACSFYFRCLTRCLQRRFNDMIADRRSKGLPVE